MRVAVESRITKNARRKKNGNPPQFPVCCARTDERTNEQMSAEPISHPSAMPRRARAPDVADSNGIHLCQTNLGFSIRMGTQPQRTATATLPPEANRPTAEGMRSQPSPIPRSMRSSLRPRFQFPWHTYSCHIKSVGSDQSSEGFRESRGATHVHGG